MKLTINCNASMVFRNFILVLFCCFDFIFFFSSIKFWKESKKNWSFFSKNNLPCFFVDVGTGVVDDVVFFETFFLRNISGIILKISRLVFNILRKLVFFSLLQSIKNVLDFYYVAFNWWCLSIFVSFHSLPIPLPTHT